jgi:predicted nucleic acid-binding protein
MMELLLDSVILIDQFNNEKKETRFLAGLDLNKAAVSVITKALILAGLESGQGVEKATADKAAELRRKFGWKLPYAFQSAITTNHGIILMTRNTKDFNPKKHTFVKIPYHLS